MTELELIARAVDVLTNPESPEGVGTTIHYLLGALLGLTMPLTEIFALLREGGWL
ncbi:hypothetical protein NYP18_08940 [Corynebacterium sp. YIM 101645]|uniref:Transposase n=1 Tax=Corynebacterium lemuris TaxID=1859292 RepID=A0ABT2FXP1_9CORY|nr:hypothetical protein [Corynebacterium lemuris]MCS5479784.1 hypothetical protein [Corynebacterium lemuris]